MEARRPLKVSTRYISTSRKQHFSSLFSKLGYEGYTRYGTGIGPLKVVSVSYEVPSGRVFELLTQPGYWDRTDLVKNHVFQYALPLFSAMERNFRTRFSLKPNISTTKTENAQVPDYK